MDMMYVIRTLLSCATRESEVFLLYEDRTILKLKDPFALLSLKGGAFQNVLYEHLAHNILFDNTPYRFKGVTEDKLGYMRFVLEQPFIEGYSNTPEKRIAKYLTERGFSLSKTEKYAYSNGQITITDVGGDNVIVDKDRRLHFIDPIIRFDINPKLALTTLEEQKEKRLAEKKIHKSRFHIGF